MIISKVLACISILKSRLLKNMVNSYSKIPLPDGIKWMGRAMGKWQLICQNHFCGRDLLVTTAIPQIKL